MTAQVRPRRGQADGAPVDPRYDDPRITAMGLLAETIGGLNARYHAQLAEYGLSPTEFEVLLRLARTAGGKLRMSDLAAQTQLTTSGITRVVDRLERDHLVERRACPTDRRGLFAHITPAGLARLDGVLPGHLEVLDRWFTGLLTADQLESLLAGLRVVRDAVRPEATAGARDPAAGARSSGPGLLRAASDAADPAEASPWPGLLRAASDAADPAEA